MHHDNECIRITLPVIRDHRGATGQSIVRKVGTGFRNNNAIEQKARPACLRRI